MATMLNFTVKLVGDAKKFKQMESIIKEASLEGGGDMEYFLEEHRIDTRGLEIDADIHHFSLLTYLLGLHSNAAELEKLAGRNFMSGCCLERDVLEIYGYGPDGAEEFFEKVAELSDAISNFSVEFDEEDDFEEDEDDDDDEDEDDFEEDDDEDDDFEENDDEDDDDDSNFDISRIWSISKSFESTNIKASDSIGCLENDPIESAVEKLSQRTGMSKGNIRYKLACPKNIEVAEKIIYDADSNFLPIIKNEVADGYIGTEDLWALSFMCKNCDIQTSLRFVRDLCATSRVNDAWALYAMCRANMHINSGLIYAEYNRVFNELVIAKCGLMGLLKTLEPCKEIEQASKCEYWIKACLLRGMDLSIFFEGIEKLTVEAREKWIENLFNLANWGYDISEVTIVDWYEWGVCQLGESHDLRLYLEKEDKLALGRFMRPILASDLVKLDRETINATNKSSDVARLLDF